jgi:hypothetical protein
MSFLTTLVYSLVAFLFINTISMAPIHAAGIGETWNHYPPSSSAQWGSVAGGFVCNRSIYWNSGAQAWSEKPAFQPSQYALMP